MPKITICSSVVNNPWCPYNTFAISQRVLYILYFWGSDRIKIEQTRIGSDNITLAGQTLEESASHVFELTNQLDFSPLLPHGSYTL